MAPKRVLIVGGVAGGAACAARLRRLDEKAEIFVFEQGPDVSFANCGLPYYLGGVIRQRQQLLVATPERFRDWLNVEVRVHREVRKIHRAERTIEVLNVQSGVQSTEHYDALVLSPGASPIRPRWPGDRPAGNLHPPQPGRHRPDPSLDRHSGSRSARWSSGRATSAWKWWRT